MKQGRNEKCNCGSGKKFKNCCLNETKNSDFQKDNYHESKMNDNLIKNLESFGYEVLKNPEGKIKVGVDMSFNCLEGSWIGWTREEPISEDKIQLVNEDDIKDYNSLWEITKSGWDSVDQLVYPYLNINGEWVRWDNIHLRENGGFGTWTKENSQKYLKHLFQGNSKLTISL